MDRYIAIEHWELFLDETKSEKEKAKGRRSLDADRFSDKDRPVACKPAHGDTGVYCETYVKFHNWFFGPKGKGAEKRNTQELLNIMTHVHQNAFSVQVHVKFTSVVFKELKLELDRLSDKENPREWNDVSKDHQSVAIIASQKAKADLAAQDDFFSQMKLKKGKDVQPLNKKAVTLN
jgi:hypothetical protein